MQVRTRIAPSPTGVPHLGNTRTALYNYLFAKKNKGKFVVRIEDTDKERLVPGTREKILQILRLLKLAWDEGPEVGGPYGPYVQSEKIKIYQELAAKLVREKKAYYCFCTQTRLEEMRKKQQQKGQAPRYNRKCLGLSESEIKKKLESRTPGVIRLKIPPKRQVSWHDLIQGRITFSSSEIDDQVLLKSDGFPTYHLGVVVDDFQMKISHVLRGVEWISSTPKHILLYEAFGWQMPLFGHLPIILGPDKSKLSKRHGAKSALDYQKEGYLPEALINFLVFLGWSYKDNSDLLSLDQLVKVFDIAQVGKTNPIFDLEKLRWFNGQWIRNKGNAELKQLIRPYLRPSIEEKKLKKIIPLVKERLVALSDINTLLEFLRKDLVVDPNLVKKQSDQTPSNVAKLLGDAVARLERIKTWNVKSIESCLRGLKSDYGGWKQRDFFLTIRVATTGFPVTPPLFESIAILGKKITLSRIKQVIAGLR